MGTSDDTGETGDNETTKTGDDRTMKTGDNETMRSMTMTAPKDKDEGQAPQQNHGRGTTKWCRHTQDDPLGKTTNDGRAALSCKIYLCPESVRSPNRTNLWLFVSV